MPYKRVQYAVCDRCGETAEIPADYEPVPVPSIEMGSVLPGWRAVGNDRLLCPKCAEGYELVLARHKVELESFISGD